MRQQRVPGARAIALAALTLMLGWAGTLCAQSGNYPPKPDRYIIDQAHVLDAGTLDSINSELEQFERDTSNQFLVAIYPSLPPDAEIAQYCTYAAESWKIGQPGKHNGVVLFIFTKDHKMYFAVARGLEGALTDATCKNIIDLEITPHFKQGDFAGGIQAGVDAAIAASKGEYKGTGSTDADSDSHGIPVWVIILVIVIIVLIQMNSRGGGFGPVVFTGGGWGGGFGGGGSFGGGGGGGGFSSGGGGGFAGGGAGGSW